MNRYFEVLPATAGSLQSLEAAFDFFQTVVDAISTADWDETVQKMGKIRDGYAVDGELPGVDAPFDEVSANNLARSLLEGLVPLSDRVVQGWQVATVSIGNHYLSRFAVATSISVAEFYFHLVSTTLLNLEGR